MYEDTSVLSFWKPVRLSAVSLSRNEGWPYHRLRLLYWKRFGRSSDPPAALLPGVPLRLRSPSGCNDVKNGREAVAADLSTATDPGAGEAAARRFSSVTVKDEGSCQTSDTAWFVKRWDRLRSILLWASAHETGLTICEGKGYAEP